MHRWPKRARGVVLAATGAVCALVVLGVSPSSTAAQASATGAPATRAPAAPAQPLTPIVTSAVRHDTSPALRTLKPAHTATAANEHVLSRLVVPHGKDLSAVTGSSAVQKGVTANSMPSLSQNFEGVGNVNGVLPPDTQGDVGPNNYVQMINLSFAIWNKQGTLLYGPVPNTTLWQGFGGPCETFNGGDPITMYDEAANRWFMSQLAYPGGPQGYHQCIAISQTPDPTGAWYRYDFEVSPDTLNDYPKFGVWPDAYYASSDEFLNEATFTGVTVQAYERDKMLQGQNARLVTFHVGDSSGIYAHLLPSDAEGGALGFNPPAGAPNPFVMFDDDAWGFSPTDRILMWDFHVDWSNPANSTFGNNGAPNRFLETAPFDSNLCNYNRSCIPQPGTSVGLDTLADRLMQRAAYRNFGGHQSIALTHSVDVNGNDQAGVRWYQLNNAGSGWSIQDQGTYAPDTDNRWMGSAALDASGDLAVGFSVSSSTTFPSIRVAGRLAGDPAGQLAQGESSMMAGTGSQTHPLSRWGDYSSLQVDPTDGCTYWYTNEYLVQTSTADWHTRIGSFKFPSCTAGPHGTLTGTVTNSSTSQPIAGATVSTGSSTTTTDAQGKYTLVLPVGSYSVTFSAFGYSTKTDSAQITDGQTTTLNEALTPKSTVHVTGTVTDGSGHGYPLYARIEITGRPGGPIYTNPATGQFSVDLPQNDTYAAKVTATLPGYQVVNDTIVVATSDLTHNVSIPIEAACTAPGYRFNLGAPVLNEPFDGATMPPGWTVVDNVGQGHQWQIGDPENRGNLTGGTGNFADINSDFYGPGNHQDTSLVTPAIDLTSVGHPVLRFHNDYNGFPGQVGDVDVSTDGGTTWSNVWSHGTDSVRGPDLEEVTIPGAAGHNNVQLRFHFVSTWGWWWQVDDVAVQNRTCDPIPGGLVVGTVNDANTGAGINGAKVTSGDQPADAGTTAATPDDGNLGDGYYWLFSTLTGAHPFTATKAPYQPSTKSVTVASNGTVRADFTLNAGRLTITPPSFAKSLVLNTTGSGTVSIKNTGTAPADVKLAERAGAFQILTLQGSPLRLIRAEEDNAFSPAWLGAQQHGQAAAGVNAGSPRDPTWSTIANYPTGIMDNSADIVDGKVYSVGGVDSSFSTTAKGFVYDPSTNTWSAIADMPIAREKPAVAAVNGKLYVTGGWDTSGNPSPRTDVYDPSTNTWSTVAPNPKPTAAPGVAVADGKIYLVGGCKDGACTTGTDVVSYDPATDSWDTGHAAYPHNDAWQACGGINGKVYCAGGTDGAGTFKNGFVLDPGANSWTPIADMPIDLWASAAGAPNGMLLASGGVTNGFSTITNQGVAYDPSSDSWSALPNSQFPRYRAGGSCGFYKIGGSSGGFSPTPDSEALSELDQCGVTDVPWLAESPTTMTLQPGQSANVTLNLSATAAAKVTQPGTYTAQLGVQSNTPYKVDPINVTMTVTPPSGWGKIAGTVTGTDCKGNTAPLRGAQVQATGKGYAFSLKTAANGTYAFWAPSASNPFTLIASKDGWIAQSTKVNIKANKTTTVNFGLHAAC